MKPRPKPKSRFRQLDPATVLLVKQFLLGFTIFATLGLIIFGVRTLTRLPAFTITTIVAEGGSTINETEVANKVATVLEGSYLRLIPRRFTYLYPEAEVRAVVQDIERIKEPNIELIDRHTISITYDEYYPDALWCTDKTKSGDECYFLDDQGYAFGKAPNLTGGSLLRVYTLQDTPSRGAYAMEVADYQAIKNFVAELGTTSWYVATAEIDSARDVFYTLAQGGELKVTLNQTGAETLRYLMTLRQSTEFEHLAPGMFQYIDLRFGSKVFVNETEETNDESATSTATGTVSVLPE